MNVSVLVPSIRPHLLPGVWDSIARSFGGAWEMVVVSPCHPPAELQGKGVLWLRDYGSPIRCRQRALLLAKGDWICWAADDVLFLPGSLDRAWRTAQADPNAAVAGKYVEGNGPDADAVMRHESYWRLRHHASLRDTVERVPGGADYLLLNTGLVARQKLLDLGGWDCAFECCAMACVDLSIRLQNARTRVHLQDEPFFRSTWLDGKAGDHGPVDEGQLQHDYPLFLELWKNGGAARPSCIPLDSWRQAPDWWERRWGLRPVGVVA